MNLRGLAFDSMPPLKVPFRFFVSAPFFVIVVGLLFLFATAEELQSRWSVFMVATTHGITLGFMLMVMLGALFQVLPVVTGVGLPQAERLAGTVHGSLVVGVVALLYGMLGRSHPVLAIGAIVVLLSLAVFLAALMLRLPAMRNTATSWAIRLAAVSLLVTISFGASFIMAWIEPSWFPGFRLWTDLHLMWGMIGWTLLLVMGVSFQIIPMFYVTDNYPSWLRRFLPALIFIQLLAFSAARSTTWLQQALLIGLTLAVATYAAQTLGLLAKRKRRSPDITIWFWNTAMTCLLLSCLVFLWRVFRPGDYSNSIDLMLACLFLFGFAVTLITGMLLKIVPFLVWLNLQQAWIKSPTGKMPLGNMQQVLSNRVARRQYQLLALTLLLLLISASGLPGLWSFKMAALSLVATFVHLAFQLFGAGQLYARLEKVILESSNDSRSSRA